MENLKQLTEEQILNGNHSYILIPFPEGCDDLAEILQQLSMEHDFSKINLYSRFDSPNMYIVIDN